MRNFWQEESGGRLVRRQHGRISWSQLMSLGVSSATAHRWARTGQLVRVLPKVYAVGHTAPSREADLWAAVLYAGLGAMLSHASAAHHCGLITYPPEVIHVSTPRVKVRSISGVIQVHGGRELARVLHDGIPVTSIAQTVLDLAASEEAKLVRRALAVLDYRGSLDREALERICGRGRRGSRELREALAVHRPELARTNGELEAAFLSLCERFGLPIPRFNVWLEGFLVDAYWPAHNLVVEVDGRAAHSSPAQLRNDRRRELALRASGRTVVRYDWALVVHAPQDVYADLVRLGVPG